MNDPYFVMLMTYALLVSVSLGWALDRLHKAGLLPARKDTRVVTVTLVAGSERVLVTPPDLDRNERLDVYGEAIDALYRKKWQE